ncbi:MAG: DUF1566 domain-containing protein [Leptospiraceae bacterium]|nr:DUF1566 domain-containing protein [Leptospiraceae bacterium]
MKKIKLYVLSLLLSCAPVANFSNPTDGVGGLLFEALRVISSSFNSSGSDALKVVLTGQPSAITEGQSVNVQIKLSKAITTNLTVTLTLDNAALTLDGVSTKDFTFTPANATSNQTFALYAVQDTNQVSETVNLKISGSGLEEQNFSVSMLDNTADLPVISVSNTVSSLTEGTTSTLGVKLTGVVTQNYTVTITSNDPAIQVAGGTSTTLTFTSANSTIDQSVILSAPQDANIISESVTISFAATELNPVQFSMTAIDNDTMNFSVTTPSSITEGSSGIMNISLTQQPSSDVAVTISSSNSTSVTVNGSNSTTLTFTSVNYGTPQNVTLAGVEDANQSSESIQITTAASGITTNTQNLVTIENDTTISFSGSTTVTEGNTATIGIAISGNPGTNRTVNLVSDTTSSVTLGTASLNFTTANWNVVQNVTITGVEDINAGSESVIITGSGTGLVTNTRTITTTDNDTLAISLSGATTLNEGGTATIGVVLTFQPSSTLMVNLASNNTSSVTIPASISFTTANWNTPQNVTITGEEDANETSETVTITASGSGVANQTRNITTIENDTKAIFGSTTSVTEGSTALLQVSLSGNPGTNRTVNLVSGNTTSLTLNTGTLNFTTANWNTPQNVTLTGVEDLNAASETVTITSTGTGLVSSTKNVDTVENDTMTIQLSGATTVNEGSTSTINVTLSNQPTSDFIVNVVSGDTNSVSVSPASLTFTSGNYTTPQSITVTGVEDANQTSEVITTTFSASGVSNVTRNISTIENDTRAVFTGATSVNEGGTATIFVALSGDPGTSRTVSLSSNLTSSLTLATSSLNFTTANWSSPQSVTINGVEDLNAAADSVTITGSGTGLANATQTIATVDNDTMTIQLSGSTTSVNEGGTATIGMALSNQPTSTFTVNLSSSNTSSVAVSPSSLTFDSGNYTTVQNVTLTGVEDANQTSETVTITASGSGVSNQTRDVTTVENDTTISFGTPSGYEGSSVTVAITLSGNPGTSRTVNFSSNNNPPTISPSSMNFTTGDYNTPQTLTLTGLLDSNTSTIITASGTGLVTNTSSVITNKYNIGGTVSGLIGTVVLQNYNSDDLTLSANGSFTFNTPRSIYSATVKTYPANQICVVSNGVGSAITNITNVIVSCSSITYALGGSAIGVLKTGQEKCYEADGDGVTQAVTCTATHLGQDAQQSKTISRSYSVNGDGTVTDNVTGLVWQRCTRGQNNDSTCSGNATTSNWSTTGSYCTSLNLASKTWRLPTLKELSTMVDFRSSQPPVDPVIFPGLISNSFSAYASSNSYSLDTSNAFFLLLDDGTNLSTSYRSKTDTSFLVRCVSGPSAVSLSFTDNNNGTITESTNGLIWQKCPYGQNTTTCSGSVIGLNWTNAINYCNNLSLSAKTWRLPNVNELVSILDHSMTPAVPSVFVETQYFLWSSTTKHARINEAFYIHAYNGFITNTSKATDNGSMATRCVSGP